MTVLLGGCGDRQGGATTHGWSAAIDTIGDTIVVRTLEGSVWGDTLDLVPELSIGALEGAEEQTLGQVQEVAPDRRGGVYVFDSAVPALRYYDSAGAYVRTLGREGAGPGEYSDVARGLRVLEDGRIALYDAGNTRMLFLRPDGTPAGSWRVESVLFTGDAMTVDTAGHFYLIVLRSRPQPGKPWPFALQHVAPDGTVLDTLVPPRLPGEPDGPTGAFTPAKTWAFSPQRHMVAGVNDDYSFSVYRPDGRIVRVEKSYDEVPVEPDERAELEALREWSTRTQGRFMTMPIAPTAEVKPPYRWLQVDDDGRIWLRLHLPARKVEAAEQAAPQQDGPPPITWREPVLYDVFEPDGTYLGAVRPPPGRIRIVAAQGDEVWGIRYGEFDEPYVMRFRLPAADE